MQLYNKDRHTNLLNKQWNVQEVTKAIQQILANAYDTFSEKDFWPAAKGEDSQIKTNKSLYFGAIGTLWGLHHLQAYHDHPIDFAGLAQLIYDRYLQEPDTGEVVPSYWLGESGILLIKEKLSPASSASILNRQYEIIKGNIKNPTLEPLWGATGTVIPVVFELEKRFSNLWQDLFIEHSQFMKESITLHKRYECPIWVQDLYGHKLNLTGAGHGFFGNMYPFLRGINFLPKELSQWVIDTTIETVIQTASVHRDCANWMSNLDGVDRGRDPFLVQWCHGSPGMIISLNNIPVGYSETFDDLMLKAGETIWQAGPLTKGIGLCHGTDGNGYAFLKLFTRSNNELWLDRARRFAMHGLDQMNGRHTLWTGDVGFACYLHSCLSVDDGFPLLDIV